MSRSAYELLEDLGKTTDEVANTLRAAGITGERMSFLHCPIANYLRANGYPDVHVGSHLASLDNDVSVALPPPVVRFIRSFDYQIIDL